MSNIGIYKIVNKTNNKVYVGQSRDLKRRFSNHKRDLKNNKHCNDYLQYSYNKYGENAFEFIILEHCAVEMLNERENHWVVTYKSHNREFGYNAVLPKSEDGGFYHSDATKQKLREKQTIYCKDELISYLQEYYYHFGKVPTTRDIDENEYFPSSGTYLLGFGSYKQALTEANLFDFIEYKNLFERKEYSREDILNLFQNFIDTNGRFPNHSELKSPYKNNLPSEAAITRWFNGRNDIREALNYAGVDKNKEQQQALDSLRRLYKEDGKVTSRTIDKCSYTRSAKYYSDNFGSLVDAYELAGIKDYKLPNNSTKSLHKKIS